MEFEWDPKKAGKNLKKYGVTFQEAATVFGDPLAMTFQDPDHSVDEERQLTLDSLFKDGLSWYRIQDEGRKPELLMRVSWTAMKG